jgi:hypothetical protein
VFESFPLIPSLKAAIAERLGKEGWRRTRPPMVPLAEAQRPGPRSSPRRGIATLNRQH